MKHRTSYKLSEKLFQGVASYIDQHYVDVWEDATYGAAEPIRNRRRRQDIECCETMVMQECAPCASMPAPKAMSLEDMLKHADAGFTETLLKLIDQTGKMDSEIYKKANISKQHFSKIRNNPDYKPTKPTAIALALALELDLENSIMTLAVAEAFMDAPDDDTIIKHRLINAMHKFGKAFPDAGYGGRFAMWLLGN